MNNKQLKQMTDEQILETMHKLAGLINRNKFAFKPNAKLKHQFAVLSREYKKRKLKPLKPIK